MADVRQVLRSGFLGGGSDFFVAIGVIVIVMMLIIPLPAVMLDTLMAFNLILSLLIVLIVLYTRNALDFSIFPSLLLVTTVFGLALNISSTRLILSQGQDFGGQLIRAFGQFVVGTTGSQGLVIGLIIFIIIIAVQFLVITRGSTRVAEVAARFTLDALPGKQMAIDQEYGQGLITEEEATRKKTNLQKEVDFYGAMDGASKFVQGNVTVGILITVINIVGGIIVGITIQGQSFASALDTYISLSIGDGLVSQFPALLVSTSTGLIVTRAISDSTFGGDVSSQFTAQSRPYWIATVFLAALAFLPGFPSGVLVVLATLSGLVGYRLTRRQLRTERGSEAADRAAPREAAPEITAVAPLDPISLELGYGLVPLVDKDQGAELLDRVTKIRRETALDLGLVVPRIRIIDNMRLEPSEYALKIRGVEVGRGKLRLSQYLAINPGTVREELSGEATTDPAFGLPALWIAENDRDRAERVGYTVVDPPSIIATHLTEVLKRNAADILGRQEVRAMLDNLRKDYPAVVEEVQAALSLGDIQKVLQGLLREQVSIRNSVAILESLADFGSVSKDWSFLVEKVRQKLARQISLSHADESHRLRVLTVNPTIEQALVGARVDSGAGPVAALQPPVQRALVNATVNAVRQMQQQGYSPVVLTQEQTRMLFRNAVRREIPNITVLAVPEIAADIRVESVGEISIGAQGDR